MTRFAERHHEAVALGDDAIPFGRSGLRAWAEAPVAGFLVMSDGRSSGEGDHRDPGAAADKSRGDALVVTAAG